MTAKLHPELIPLVGSWRLVSMAATLSGSGERVEPLGAHPEGRMVLEPSGRIIFLLAKAGRKLPESEADRAALFDAMGAYSGLVRRSGSGEFTTSVDLSSHPGWSGEQRRFFSVVGDRLIIRTPEQAGPASLGGRWGVGEIVFQREGSPALLLGATFPEIRAVVAQVASGVLWMGIHVGDKAPAEATSAWTLNGRPLPLMWHGIAADAVDWARSPIALSPGYVTALRDSDTVEQATSQRPSATPAIPSAA